MNFSRNPLKALPVILSLLLAGPLTAQVPDQVYQPSIHSVQLYVAGNMNAYPVMRLNSGDQLELHFDDFDGGYKNFYYTFQLCNADWSVSNVPTFDYIKGFQSTRISTYRNSSISLIPYTHYQATVPDRSSTPGRSGNYMLKVFRNNDTSDLFFTRRFLIVDGRTTIAAQIKQPFSQQTFLTDQRIQVQVNTASANINALSPQDLKVVVLQNNIWRSSVLLDRPSIFRGNYFEYNDDNISFPSGREWRWLDMRSLRLISDRMRAIVDTGGRTDVYVKTETERKQQIYFYYKDYNGAYFLENSDGNNPYWQSDYAWVHFTYAPPGGVAYAGKEMYVFGQLTNYQLDETSRMVYNNEKGFYEATVLLKQGYYNYAYVTADAGTGSRARFSFANTEGNFTNTENTYTILLYYRGFGSRGDELIGYSQVSSFTGR